MHYFTWINLKIPCLIALVHILACSSEKETPTETQSSQENTQYREQYRPSYHFSPERNWMNDPNGLVYHNGEYHLFYQYNPFGTKWGHMSWGHAVSEDLIQWQHLPVALQEEDNTMIFSGSVVVDKGNRSNLCPGPEEDCMVAIYTSHIEDSIQHQSIAFSNDSGRTWQKYSQNPVLDLGKRDFRDPKVFWHEESNKWIMAVALPLDYKVQFYSSDNLVDWQYLSEFGNVGNTSKIWECPDLFPLTIEKDGSTHTKWVLIVSAGGPQKEYVGVQYFIGNFDGNSFQLDESFDSPKWVDFGKDFYASVTFNHVPNNRILVGWANNWAYAQDIPTSSWRGAMAIPRELTLITDPEGSFFLRQQPFSGLARIRRAGHRFRDITLTNEIAQVEELDSSNILELNIQFEILDAAEFGIRMETENNFHTLLKYSTETQSLIFDRTKGSDTLFNELFVGIDTVMIPLEDTNLDLRVFLDQSIIEVFAENGKYTLVNQVFPDGAISLSWYAKDGSVVVKKAEAWELGSIWE